MTEGFNIQKECMKLHCDTLFECTSECCLIQLSEGALGLFQLDLVLLYGSTGEDFGEEHDVMTNISGFLISCDDVNKITVIISEAGMRLEECLKIFCCNEKDVEVFEIKDGNGQDHFQKHDPYGFCWQINTERCDIKSKTEWTSLMNQSQELSS